MDRAEYQRFNLVVKELKLISEQLGFQEHDQNCSSQFKKTKFILLERNIFFWQLNWNLNEIKHYRYPRYVYPQKLFFFYLLCYRIGISQLFFDSSTHHHLILGQSKLYLFLFAQLDCSKHSSGVWYLLHLSLGENPLRERKRIIKIISKNVCLLTIDGKCKNTKHWLFRHLKFWPKYIIQDMCHQWSTRPLFSVVL